jgi:hypothetical protein
VHTYQGLCKSTKCTHDRLALLFFGNGFGLCSVNLHVDFSWKVMLQECEKNQYLNGSLYLKLSVNSGVNYLIMKWSQFQTTLMMQALSILVITLNVTCSKVRVF